MPDTRTLKFLDTVKFKGHLRDGKNLSAAGLVGDFLLVAGDEDDRVQVLRRDGHNYELLPDRAAVLNPTGQEADIEGIACDGDTVFVVGSHSRKRPKLKASASRAENRARLETPEPLSPFRCLLAKFSLTSAGVPSVPELESLSPTLAAIPVLRPFLEVPCKENGIDIEGLAVHDGRLFVGFRGPVLQHGLVPVLVRPFAAPPEAAEVLYLDLLGRGVRDIERVGGGFLVLAGPVNDLAAGFELYFWDGRDCTPGGPEQPGRLISLGAVPTPDGAKAEGIAVEKETDDSYVLLVLFDGLKEGGATRFRVGKST